MYIVDNAIILAAGMSSRFTPFCIDKPKCLWEIDGEVLIERLIRQLKESGIEDIIIVIGHESEQFYYLCKKFDNIKLIFNKDYKNKNNIYSLYKAFEYLNNSIVVSADLLFKTNPFLNKYEDSVYTSVYCSAPHNERLIITDKENNIKTTFYDETKSGYVTFGYAFFSEEFSSEFKKLFVEHVLNDESKNNFYWADLQDMFLEQLHMKALKMNSDEIIEFDSFKDIKKYGLDKINFSCNKKILKIIDMCNIDIYLVDDFLKLNSINQLSFIINNKIHTINLGDDHEPLF